MASSSPRSHGFLVLSLVMTALFCSSCGRKEPGAQAYGPNCGICHHGGGGMPGEIPPLVGRLDIIAQTSAGRHYLANALLYGLQGPISTQGYHYNYAMPAFGDRLSNREIADVLNWLIARGETKPAPHITEDEVAAARAHVGDPTYSFKLRKSLDQAHPLP